MKNGGKMRNFLLVLIIFYSFTIGAQAAELVLSDRIREAREAAQLEQARTKVDEQIKPVREILDKENTFSKEMISEKEPQKK